jgi:hypothetical protein
MTDNRFPVASFAEAMPYLRAPYTPDLVHGIVVSAPDNDQAPCKIALYVTSETVMSRLNIVCGLNWGARFEKVVERIITNGERTMHYMQVRAYVTVFGRTFEDLGEATEEGQAMSEYRARAQAFKRAARWVEVGHCLYAADQIVMWRGDGDKKIRIPRTGEKPHKHPYQDERSERYIRAQYEHWLEHTGTRTYGEPLDHSTAAQGRIEVAEPQPPGDILPRQTVDAEHQSTIHPQEVPAPGMIVNPEIVQSASDAGFGEAVARQMTQLARGDEQVGQLTEAQAQTVQGWIADLASLNVKEETVLAAVDFTLERSPGRQAAQAKFTAWIHAKVQSAQAAHTADAEPPARSNQTQTEGVPSDPATRPDAQAAPNGQPMSAIFPSSTRDRAGQDAPGLTPGVDQQPLTALDELAHTIERYGYQQSVVGRMVALSQGKGPESQIPWESLPEDRLREITRLLHCAAQLRWDNARLQQMVMRAHNSANQNTPAGRYATFGNHLTNAARDQAAEAARVAA